MNASSQKKSKRAASAISSAPARPITAISRMRSLGWVTRRPSGSLQVHDLSVEAEVTLAHVLGAHREADAGAPGAQVLHRDVEAVDLVVVLRDALVDVAAVDANPQLDRTALAHQPAFALDA